MKPAIHVGLHTHTATLLSCTTVHHTAQRTTPCYRVFTKEELFASTSGLNCTLRTPRLPCVRHKVPLSLPATSAALDFHRAPVPPASSNSPRYLVHHLLWLFTAACVCHVVCDFVFFSKVPMASVSGLAITSLQVFNEKYRPYKGVRTLTKSGKNFQVRTG